MNTAEILLHNINRLIEIDGRSIFKLAHDLEATYDGYTWNAWRNVIIRIRGGSWPQPYALDALADVLGVEPYMLLVPGAFDEMRFASKPSGRDCVKFRTVQGESWGGENGTRGSAHTIGQALGKSDAEVDAMTWPQIERALDDAVRALADITIEWSPE